MSGEAGTNAFFIHRLQWGTQTWVNTGVQLDDTRDPLDPKNVKADTLWDDTNKKLYVLSHDYAENPGTVKEASSGQLFVALKLHGDTPADPEIGVVAMDTNGTFSFHEYSTRVDNDTRPILIIDDAANTLNLFVTGKTTGGGKIYYKTLSIPGPGELKSKMGDFPPGDCGTTFIEDKANVYKNINDATSMKGNVNDLTGIVILAADDINDQVYVHNVMGDPPPVVDATSPARNATLVPLTSTVTATFSKDMDAGTLSTGSFIVKGPNSNTQVFGTVTYNAASKTATFAPNQNKGTRCTWQRRAHCFIRTIRR